jgi:hypothetical protein
MTQKEIQPYILPGLLVIGVIYILNKFKGTAAQQAATTQSDIQTQQAAGIKQTYTNTTYDQLADRIEAAGKTAFGTDEAAIYSVFNLLKNDVDFLKLAQAFGQRRIEFSAATANLSGWLQSELNAAELNKVNAIMEKNKLKSRI